MTIASRPVPGTIEFKKSIAMDASIESEDADPKKIIQALRAKTVANGATPAEAASAKSKADELEAKLHAQKEDEWEARRRAQEERFKKEGRTQTRWGTWTS